MTQYGLEENEIAAIKNILAQHEEVEQAILYGSRAKGNFKPASDIDLVLKGEKLTVTIQNCIADELDDLLLPYKFDLSVFHQISNEDLLEHIKRIGVTLHSINSVLEFDDWKDEQLDALIDTLIDYRGKTPPKTSSGIPLITAKIVKNGFIQEPNEFIANDNYNSWMTRGFPEIGDVVLTTEAPLGEVAQIRDRHVALAQRIVVIRGKEGVLDNGYLKYFLQSETGQRRLRERETGSTVSGIRQSELRKVLIRIPSIIQQSQISNILSSLDEKIELNRQINRTLEEIAKTLFQEMCVPKGDELPEGWRVGKLGDVCRNVRKTVNPRAIESSTPYVGLEHIPRRSLTLNEYGNSEDVNSQKSSFEQYHILFGKLRPYFHKVCIAPVAGICSTDILVIEPVDNDYFSFCLNHLFSDELIRYVSSVADGTRMPRVDWKSINNYDVFIPDTGTLKKLNDICFPNYKKMMQNAVECIDLAKLRDSMLPKLMNGSIFVEN